MAKILIEQFMHGLSIDSYILPQNLASLSQSLLLLLMGEYVYMGYIDALIPDQRLYALSLRVSSVHVHVHLVPLTKTGTCMVVETFGRNVFKTSTGECYCMNKYVIYCTGNLNCSTLLLSLIL